MILNAYDECVFTFHEDGPNYLHHPIMEKACCFLKNSARGILIHRFTLEPLLLTWIDFNRSMDK